MTQFRMIVADLDGTLRVEQRPPTPRVVRAIREAQARGVRVVLATGRMFLTAQPLVEQLGLKDAVICNHGATILDLVSGRELFVQQVPIALAREVLDYGIAHHYSVLVDVDEHFYTPEITPDALAFVARFRDHLHVPPDWGAVLERGPVKLTFVNEPETTLQILAYLRTKFGGRLQVVQSFARYAEVTHPDASKGRAAAWLADRWGIPRREVLAMGDHDNDRSMVEWAGLGVAMGNAIPELRALAGYVAPTVEEDGAAQVIEEFVLKDGLLLGDDKG